MLDRAKVQPDSWPTRAQVKGPMSEANWLVGRLYWWDQRAVAKGYNRPLKVITEAGQDAMGVYADIDEQLKNRYGVSNGHHTTRGWDSWANVYEAYYSNVFPEPVPENTQLAFMRWWDEIYDETILGINFFIWSPNAYDWDTQFGFDYSKSVYLQGELIKWTEGRGIPAPTTPQDPGPTKPPPEDARDAQIERLTKTLERANKTIQDALAQCGTAAEALNKAVENLRQR
jgi:hypothetical protein